MKKLNKIFSIVLTAAIAVSMLVAAAPVAAADNEWTAVTMPSFTSNTGSGFLTKAIDGTLYAWTNDATNLNRLAKSTDGGRTWKSVKTPNIVAANVGTDAITAIATSPNEANVVYVALSNGTVWKSVTSGDSFAATPVGTVAGVKSLAVGLLGGSYKIFAGSAGGVFLFDEGILLNNQFVQFGGLTESVIDIKLGPTFSSGAQIYALTSPAGVDAKLWVSTGGAFAPVPATIASGAGTTTGEIGFSADFDLTNNPVLWVGVNGATGGIFRTTIGGTGFKLGATLPVATIEVTGSGVFGGAVTIAFGTTAGEVYTTSNAGISFSLAGKNLTGTGTAFVALANDYATSNTIFVLKAASGANDESAFSVSTDKGANFNQISLINSALAAIMSTAFATNGDVYMTTAKTAVVTPAAPDTIVVSSVTGGTVTVGGTVVFVADAALVGTTLTIPAAGSVTLTVATAGTLTLTAGTAADATAAEGVDTNGSFTVAGLVVTGTLDINAAFTTYGNASLWRSVGGKWDRIQGDQTAGKYAMIAVSPNYATDKGVYYVSSGTTIMASTNNGVSFTAQSFSPGTINSFVILDNATFVVATAATGIQRTTNNGFVWNQVSTATAAFLVRSSDGTAIAAVGADGAVRLSSDLGATWGTAAGATGAPAGISAVTFQNGSNTVLWGTTATGGIYKIDMAATTKAWTAQPTAAALTNGVGIASGVAASPVIYALNAGGELIRLLGDASATETTAVSAAGASKLFIVPAAGGNTVWAVTATKLYTFKDTMAVAVPSVAVATFTTQTANVTFGAVAGATDYAVFVSAGSAAQKDYFTATTVGTVTVDKTARTASITGLSNNTTYTISVFAKTPLKSLVGSVTFSTQPNVPPPPVGLAPAPAATGIPTMPSFQWGAIAGATSYELELSTSPTFSPLTGTKITAVVPAAAWTGTALANNTVYYWRVRAITATGTSDWVVSTFTTVAATPTTPPVTIPTSPVVTPTVTVVIPDTETPTYIWAIIGVGALLTVLVIVLIVRTRRVV